MGQVKTGEIIEKILQGPFQHTVESLCGAKFSSTPKFAEHTIIEYQSRMRISGMEIFNGSCYMSYVNFFKTPQEREAGQAGGAFVVSMEYDNASRLLRAMGQDVKADEDDDEIICAALKEACKIIAETFKGELVKAGYSDLILSEAQAFKNEIITGIPFCYDEEKYYSLELFFWKQKALCLNVTLGAAASVR